MPTSGKKKKIESGSQAREGQACASNPDNSGLAQAGEECGARHENIGPPALQVISFYLNADEYAFEVADAFEVTRPRQYTEVPLTPDFIKGVASVRGEMVAIIDLKARLDIPAPQGKGAARPPRLLIAGREEHRAGFLVDGIGGVRELPGESLEEATKSGADVNGFAKAVAVLDGKRTVLLDLEKLLDTSP